MRTALILVTLLLAVHARAEPAVLRLVVIHEAELLPSEEKALAAAEKKLARLGTVTRAGATAGEAAFAAAPSGTPPAEWQGAATVVVLRVLPPSGAKGKRLSRGVGDVLVFRPPLATPVYAERVEGEAAAALRAETLAPWLAELAGLAARAGGGR